MDWTVKPGFFPTLAAFLFIATGFLRAADPSPATNPAWKEKPFKQWDEEDAKQLLADSPWVKFNMPQKVRDLSVFERRDSGDWNADMGSGVWVFGTGIFGPRRASEATQHAHVKPPAGTVLIRWESALPVRTAERKTGEAEIPSLDSDGYAIAVYDVPLPDRWNLTRELKGLSYIRRLGKRDIKASGVHILRHADGTATLVYLFPRSVEISGKDGCVEFVAQVGALVLSDYFYTEDMRLQDELQLLMPSEERH